MAPQPDLTPDFGEGCGTPGWRGLLVSLETVLTKVPGDLTKACLTFETFDGLEKSHRFSTIHSQGQMYCEFYFGEYNYHLKTTKETEDQVARQAFPDQKAMNVEQLH